MSGVEIGQTLPA